MLFTCRHTVYELVPGVTSLAPSKHETFTQCWFNVGPPSATLSQHWANIGWTSRVSLAGCWMLAQPSKHETPAQWWFKAGSKASTSTQHKPSIGSTSRVCWQCFTSFGQYTVAQEETGQTNQPGWSCSHHQAAGLASPEKQNLLPFWHCFHIFHCALSHYGMSNWTKFEQQKSEHG